MLKVLLAIGKYFSLRELLLLQTKSFLFPNSQYFRVYKSIKNREWYYKLEVEVARIFYLKKTASMLDNPRLPNILQKKLTRHNGPELLGIAINQTILESSSTDSPWSNQSQGLSPERWHPGDFLVQQQLGRVELVVALRLVHLALLLLGYSGTAYADLVHEVGLRGYEGLASFLELERRNESRWSQALALDSSCLPPVWVGLVHDLQYVALLEV